jgi:acyl carrier protein
MEKLSLLLAEILEVDAVNDSDKLKEFECWDSLTTLSIIAGCHDEFGVVLRADDVNKLDTVKELKDLIAAKMS